MSTASEIVYRSEDLYGHRFEVHHVDELYVLVRRDADGEFVISWRSRSLERAKAAAERSVELMRAIHSERLVALSAAR